MISLARPFRRRFAALCSGLLLAAAALPAQADKLDDNLQTVWESLWDQRGVPVQLYRWDRTITYRIHGHDVARHLDHLQNAVKRAAALAGLSVNDISGQPDAATLAMLDIEIVTDTELQDNEPCFARRLKAAPDWGLEKMQVKMRTASAWRCTYHEMMHAMGINGHPSGKSVLSYFPYRRDVFMDMDQLMLKAWYSPAMRKGATPLEALQVLSQAVAQQDDLGIGSEEARIRATVFNQRKLQDMEALANGKGEVPDIVLRSGKASTNFMASAQPGIAYFVGLAYLRGVIAVKDNAAAARWFKLAAIKRHSGAQVMYARALIRGTGVEVDQLAGHGWLLLAATGGNTIAATELTGLEKNMDQQEVEKARATAAPAVDAL